MENKYPVSVIMTIFNSDAYLEKSLVSLLRQSLDIFEIILIDDGSSDNSLDIAKATVDLYPNRKQHINIISRDNKGVAFSRAEGINLASGEYVIFMDSDDWVNEDWLQQLIGQAYYKQSDIVVCDFYNVFENHRLLKREYKIDTEDNNENWFRKLLVGNVSNSNCNKLIRRKLYTANQINFHNGYDMGEDFFVTMKLFFTAKRISYIPKGLYHYNRTNENSLTSIFTEKSLKDLVSIVLMTESFIEESGEYNKFQSEIIQLKIRTKQTILRHAPCNNKRMALTTFREVNKSIFTYGSRALMLFYMLWLINLDVLFSKSKVFSK